MMAGVGGIDFSQLNCSKCFKMKIEKENLFNNNTKNNTLSSLFFILLLLLHQWCT